MGEAGLAKWKMQSSGPGTWMKFVTSCFTNTKSRPARCSMLREVSRQQVVHADDGEAAVEQQLATGATR